MTAELRPASSLDLERLAGLFNGAYSDYFVPTSLEAAAFALINELWDIDLGASRVVGEEAFALLGVRGRRGWIGGMGVVPGRAHSVLQLAADEPRVLLAAAAPLIWLNVPADDPATRRSTPSAER